MAASQGLRLALGAALAGAAASAQAGWQCTDAFGNAYRFERLPGDGDLKCAPEEATMPDDAAAGSPAPPTPATVLAAAPPTGAVFVATSLGAAWPRGGGLVLAPPGAAAANAATRRMAFDPLIESIARSTHQDADLLRAIVQVESRFDPAAVSAKGAIGLMQVMPATAAELGLAEPRRALFEPESNLRIGALHLRRLLDTFPGDPTLAIAAYNAGEGAVMRSGFAVPPYPETQGYVRDVLAIWNDLRASH